MSFTPSFSCIIVSMKTGLWHLTIQKNIRCRVGDTMLPRFKARHLFKKQNLTQLIAENGVSARPGSTNGNCPALLKVANYRK